MLKLHVLTLVSVLLLAIAVGCSSGDVDPPECDRIRLSGPITLSDAAQYDCAATALALIEPAGSIPGVDVNAPDDDGNIPLVVAAEYNSVNVARMLIDSGADIDSASGSTLLHIAAWNNSLDVFTLLIDRGADIDAKDKDRITPLREAALNNSLDVARLLIDSGANTDVIDMGVFGK
jgi:ankyrin repeat protein